MNGKVALYRFVYGATHLLSMLPKAGMAEYLAEGVPDHFGCTVAVDDQVNGISLLAALRAYTSAGAYATFEEDVKGTLEPGMLADLQVYCGDPLGEDPNVNWEELRPRAVLLGGARVYGSL